MAEGRVTAISLNLRDAPNGAIVGVLRNGDNVDIRESSDGWLRVSAAVNGDTKLGWVSAAFVSTTAAAAPAPPPDDAAHPVTVSAGKAIGPDGSSFANAYGSGFATKGVTTLDAWLSGTAAAPPLAPSIVRVVRAVSTNEGRLEAINSYDNAFLSFGLLQWTAGVDTDPGELAGLLALVRQTSQDAFQAYFGQYGLGTSLQGPVTTAPVTGFLTLAGAALRSPADKARLRDPTWAYRFWRAGHDETVRACELALAAARIAPILHHPVDAGRVVGDWLTSEYGVALVLDEHVNRPGHVPGTLEQAIAGLPAGADPTRWTDQDEADLIQRYIAVRGTTSMTASGTRAIQIGDCVHAGTLSDKRGSFVPIAAAGV